MYTNLIVKNGNVVTISIGGGSDDAWNIVGSSTVIAKIPTGYRPIRDTYVYGRYSSSTSPSGSQLTFLSTCIKSNGDVLIHSTNTFTTYKYTSITGSYGV